MTEATAPAPAAAPAPVAPSGAPIVENGGTYAEAQLSETQNAALKEVANLRIEYGKTPTDAILKKMGALQVFALAGGEKPADFMPSDPLPPDLSEHDDMAGTFSGLNKPMTADELSQLKFTGTVKGLHPTVSGAVSDFVREFAVPKVIADQILDRATKHLGATHDEPAFERIETLSSEQQREYYEEASRAHPGGSEALNKLTTEVRGMLQERGLLERFEKVGLTRTSLAFDARVLHALRLWLQTAPARA
jgi:hypothetical protein